jgi:polysaccharide deacetylase 2 family uncharacterized protein YibQ
LAPPPKSRSSFGGIALVAAWLLLLGVVGAAAGYVLMQPDDRLAGAGPRTRVALAPAPEEAAQPAKPPEPAIAKTETPSAPVTAAEEPSTAKDKGETLPETKAEAAPLPEQQAAPEPETTAKAEAAPKPEAAPEIPKAPDPPKPPAPEAVEAKTPAPEPKPEPEPETAAPAASGTTQQAALPEDLPPGERPQWRRNSQPFDAADDRPRIAIVLTGLGLSSAATETAIKELPPGITLSFTPFARKLNQWVALARVNGHEVMLDLPMEPTSYPEDDPGPRALLTALSTRQNLERLDWTLNRVTGYVGVATVMGSRFTASEAHMEPVLQDLKQRGLLFLDNRASDDSIAAALAAKIGTPRAVNDRSLDRTQASRTAVDGRLVQLENIALTKGYAVAMGRPYPVTIERLREWSKDLESRGFALAPITALADRQPLQETAAASAPTNANGQ